MRGGAIGGSIFNKRHWQPAGPPPAWTYFGSTTSGTRRWTAVAEGAHPKAIQRRMVHSTINMTLDRYGHLFPELDRQVASDVGAILEKAASGATRGTVSTIRTGEALVQP